MLWYILVDCAERADFDSSFLPKMLGYIEKRTAFETLSKVLAILYAAQQNGLTIDKVIGIIDYWRSNLEDDYYHFASEIDGAYKLAYTQLERILERLAEKDKQEPKQELVKEA